MILLARPICKLTTLLIWVVYNRLNSPTALDTMRPWWSTNCSFIQLRTWNC